MKITMVRTRAAGAAAGLLLACHGATTAPDVSTVAGFCPAYVDALVSMASACGEGPIDLLQGSPYVQAYCSGIEAAVAAGRIAFDPSHASACIQAVQGATCAIFDDTSGTPSPCLAAVHGIVAAGGACFSGEDCLNQGSCTMTSSNGPGGNPVSYPCGGTCAAAAAPGASCTVAVGCGGQYICDPTSLTCVRETLTPLVQAGGSCARSSSTYVACATGLLCDQVTFTCTKFVPEGGACAAGHGICELMTSCDATTKTCKRSTAGAGAPCGQVTAGADPIDCAGTNECVTTSNTAPGVCTPLLAVGATCGGSTDVTRCESNNCCAPAGSTANICVAPQQ